MRNYNIDANLIRAIEHLYNNAISADQMNDSTGERMSFLTRPLQHFLERILSDVLEEHDENVSIGGRTINICGLPMTLLLLLKKSRNYKS